PHSLSLILVVLCAGETAKMESGTAMAPIPCHLFCVCNCSWTTGRGVSLSLYRCKPTGISKSTYQCNRNNAVVLSNWLRLPGIGEKQEVVSGELEVGSWKLK